VINIRNVSKAYDSRRGPILALEDVSFDVNDGEFVCLVGPSGCGKSTLLKLILGIMPPTGGEISINGVSVTAPRSDCSMMFQSPLLLPWRNVRDNVLFPVEILRRRRKDYEDRANALLEMVGVASFAAHYPRELSGGMQQRVAICRALIHEPDILLLDEPFAALDSITREQLNDDLLKIWAETGRTIVLVTHNIEEAVYLSNRVVVFSDRPGRVIDKLAIGLPTPRADEMRRSDVFYLATQEIRRALGLARPKPATQTNAASKSAR
jgi:NitT/TauT family transport system ATP-binding protein